MEVSLLRKQLHRVCRAYVDLKKEQLVKLKLED